MEALKQFLIDLEPCARETVTWGNGTIHLGVQSYVSTALPPMKFISSVRGIVFRNDEVLCVRNPRETHIVPGGRIEPGEDVLGALQRELLEETGWHVEKEMLLGFMHFRLLSGPAQPDFLQVVFAGEAAGYCEGARLEDDYEIESHFIKIEDVDALEISPSQTVFLETALKMRASDQP